MHQRNEDIMIDTREYETRKQLVQAMKFESNCAKLYRIRNIILKLENTIEILKNNLELYKKEADELQKEIDIFTKNNTDKTIDMNHHLDL